MNKSLFTLFLLVSSSFLLAQEKVDLQVMQQIINEENKHSHIESLAHYLTDICGSRLTNSPGYRKAVAWSVQTLKQWGLQQAVPEAWGEYGKGWSNEHTYLAMKAPYYQPLIAYPVAWTSSTPGLISAKLVMLDKLDSTSIDQLGDALKGSVVMVRPANPSLRTAFKADAYRYDDSELDKLPESHLNTPNSLSNKNTANHIYDTRRYLQQKGH